MNDRPIPLGTEPEVGTYRVRLVKNGPWVPVRVTKEQGLWVCLIAGRATPDSGREDPFEIGFLLIHWPLHRVSSLDYFALCEAHDAVQAGHPLAQPGQAVDLRNAPSLW